MDVQKMQRAIGALALTNLALYLARAAVAGTMINDTLNGESNLGIDENAATPILVQTTLILSMIGFASSFAGLLHLKEWSSASRLVGVGVGVIACMLDFLACAYAIKMWEIGGDNLEEGELGERAQTVGSIAVIQVVTQLLFVGVIFKTPVHDGHEENENQTASLLKEDAVEEASSIKQEGSLKPAPQDYGDNKGDVEA